jgi:SAM-dependent methyltransferase
MGFVKGNMIPILKEAKERPFYGSLLFLGYPDCYFTGAQFQGMASEVGVKLKPEVQLEKSDRHYFKRLGCVAGESVFKSLGFEKLDTLDFSDFEGADIVFDLNSANLPKDLAEKYDCIIDHGTMEHIFHIPNVLNNIFQLLRVGGRIVHSSPSSNFVDHGFYMFSPTFFFDFYKSNKFEINSIRLTQSTPRQTQDPCFYTDYTPGCLDSVSYGGLDNSIYGTICIATKTKESTGDVIPQQGLYKKVWGQTKWDRTNRLVLLRKVISKMRSI